MWSGHESERCDLGTTLSTVRHAHATIMWGSLTSPRNFSDSPLHTMAAWRIARAVKGKCLRAGIGGFVKPTVHQAVTTNCTNRYKNISDQVASTASTAYFVVKILDLGHNTSMGDVQLTTLC